MSGALLCKVFTLVGKPAPTGSLKVLAASVLPLNIRTVLLARVQELTLSTTYGTNKGRKK